MKDENNTAAAQMASRRRLRQIAFFFILPIFGAVGLMLAEALEWTSLVGSPSVPFVATSFLFCSHIFPPLPNAKKAYEICLYTMRSLLLAIGIAGCAFLFWEPSFFNRTWQLVFLVLPLVPGIVLYTLQSLNMPKPVYANKEAVQNESQDEAGAD